MGHEKLRRVRLDVIKMAVWSRLGREVDVVLPRRQKEDRPAACFIMQAIMSGLVQGKDSVHSVVRRPLPNGADGRRDIDGFRLFRIVKIGGLRIEAEAGPHLSGEPPRHGANHALDGIGGHREKPLECGRISPMP